MEILPQGNPTTIQLAKRRGPRGTGTRLAGLPSGSQCNARDSLLTTGGSLFFLFFLFLKRMVYVKRARNGIFSSTCPRAVHFQAVLSRLSGKHRDEFQSIYVQRAGFVCRSILTASRLCASGYTKQKACDIGDGYKDAAKHYRDRTAGGEFITSAELSALLPPIVADHLASLGNLRGAPCQERHADPGSGKARTRRAMEAVDQRHRLRTSSACGARGSWCNGELRPRPR